MSVASEAPLPEAVRTLVAYWFGPLEQGFPKTPRNRLWFGGARQGGRIDQEIRARFGALHAQALAGALDDWGQWPRGRLALLLLLDQFSRNIYRGLPEAFAADPLALAHARACVDAEQDHLLAPIERLFCYLPFEHSESLADQDQSVQRVRALMAQTDPACHAQLAPYLTHALEHREVIRRFGRFPHRNAVLGRTSTEAERLFLQTAPGYGQTARNEAP